MEEAGEAGERFVEQGQLEAGECSAEQGQLEAWVLIVDEHPVARSESIKGSRCSLPQGLIGAVGKRVVALSQD